MNSLTTDSRGQSIFPPLLAAPGKIILHAPRSLNTHSMQNFPD